MRSIAVLSLPLLLLLLIPFKPALAQMSARAELKKDSKSTVPSSLKNRCLSAHVFQLSESPEIEWVGLAGAHTIAVGPMGEEKVEFEFDSAGLEVGTYHGEVAIACLDCASEPLCVQRQFIIPVQLKVIPSREELTRMQGKFVEGQVLVSFGSRLSGVVRKRIREIERKYRLKRLKIIKLTSRPRTLVLFAILDPTGSVPLLVTELEGEPDVGAQPNFIYTSKIAQKRDYVDPGMQYGPRHINAYLAHSYSTGKDIRVALLDTGVDDRHKDLKGKVVVGGNFTDQKSRRQDTHGTIMAGIIAAIPNNGFGINGIAPDAKLISIKVLKSAGQEGVGTSDTIVQGVESAIAARSNIINMSLGLGLDDDDQELDDSVKEAVRRGIVVVAAAGNDGQQGKPSYPAALDDVIAVSAVGKDNSFYSQGTWGDYIDLAAPGVYILSTMPGNKFDFTDGTSQAAAHVTGVVALLLEKRPNTSPQRIKEVLEATSRPLGAGGKDVIFGSGLVDACQAMEALIGRSGMCN